jgi:hypothetical protein
MARKNPTASAPAETSTEENPVTEQTPEGTVPESPEVAAQAVADIPVDLTAFNAAVEVALGEADTTTGEVPEASIAKVNETYRPLEGAKGKGAARKALEEAMLVAVQALDAVKARSYSDLRNGLAAGGGSSTPKAPADPKAAFIQRLATVQIALGLVRSDLPEGADATEVQTEVDKIVAETADSVAAFQTWAKSEAEDKGDAPETSPVVRAAFKMASGKGSGGTRATSTGPRGDIGKHIQAAFTDKEVGTFLTVAEIVKAKSPEYPDSPPSAGAVSARLFPSSGGKTTVEGIEAVESNAVDGKNPKGARKVA